MTDDQRTDKAAYLLKLITNLACLRLLLLLASNGEMSVTALEQQLLIEPSLISHHLQKMRDNGLIAGRQQVVYKFYFLPETGFVEDIKRYLNGQS